MICLASSFCAMRRKGKVKALVADPGDFSEAIFTSVRKAM